MNYYGVPDVIYCTEICVPAAQHDRAIEALESAPDYYEHSREFYAADFYHPWLKGRPHFRMKLVPIVDQFYCRILTCEEMCLGPEIFEQGSQRNHIHAELQPWTKNVSDDTLSLITWPSLSVWIKGWFELARRNPGIDEYLYLAQVQKLIEATDVDRAWVDRHISNETDLRWAERILKWKPIHKAQWQDFEDPPDAENAVGIVNS
ncbi:hypothetical protein LTR66_007549 [Elasticomyces elasticus]|nr:hypothetical protein LTR66_007549 [Elasticomyces elasticus]